MVVIGIEEVVAATGLSKVVARTATEFDAVMLVSLFLGFLLSIC